ncbi:MAG: hypothetical protein M0Q88_01100 [Bacilli bacterium]|nr:hypothetical protein [Bacilli bacterium]
MKYYYGNSYKEAMSNDPVEINSIRILKQYQDVYNVVIAVEEDEQFYMLVSKEKGSNEELSERYDDFDDVRADFKYLTEQTPEEYEYVVMQKVTESQIDGETIEELASWGLE